MGGSMEGWMDGWMHGWMIRTGLVIQWDIILKNIRTNESVYVHFVCYKKEAYKDCGTGKKLVGKRENEDAKVQISKRQDAKSP